MEAVVTKFGCDACGKLFSWKPAIAGKRAKCTCGSELTVPKEPPGQGSPRDQAPDEDGAYDLKEEAPKPAVVLPPRQPAPAEAPGARSATKTLGYAGNKTKKEQLKAQRDAIAEGGMIASPVKDLWAPLGLLAAGLVMLPLYGLLEYGSISGAIVSVLFFGVIIGTKSILTLGVAWLSAGWLDVSFGHPLTAAFKLLAMLLFVGMGVEILAAFGGFGGFFVAIAVGWVGLLILSCWLFEMDMGTAMNFAALCAIVNRIVGWGVLMMLNQLRGGI